MFKKLLNTKVLKNQKGLTLIELLAVIVILAIVAAIAIPAIGNIIDNSRYSGVKGDALNALNGANIYFTDNPNGIAADIAAGSPGGANITLSEIKAAGYLESLGSLPETATVSITQPHELSGATSSQTVNGYTVTFTGATIDEINADVKKGSSLAANEVIGD